MRTQIDHIHVQAVLHKEVTFTCLSLIFIVWAILSAHRLAKINGVYLYFMWSSHTTEGTFSYRFGQFRIDTRRYCQDDRTILDSSIHETTALNILTLIEQIKRLTIRVSDEEMQLGFTTENIATMDRGIKELCRVVNDVLRPTMGYIFSSKEDSKKAWLLII
jgi:hypothetical protein